MATQFHPSDLATLADLGAEAPRSPPAVPKRSDRIYVAMGLLLLVLVALAFGARYFGRAFTDAPPLPLFVHVHVFLFIGWILLFTIQATLAQNGRFRHHRQLGLVGMGLGVIVVVAGLYSAIQGARRGHNPGGAPNALVFMIVGVGDIALFAAFVGAAWYLRKQRELHKRLMLFATLGGFLWPTIVRLPFASGNPPIGIGILAFVLLIPLVTNWITRRRMHALDVIGAVAIFGSFPLRMAIGSTNTWQRFAAWLIS